jgi:transcriptional regulator with XRE-family HTH domain
MKEKSPWSEAHIALKRLWDERIAPTGMSQEEFGDKYGIGTQGMVSQYLLGTRPLNYDAAAKFARGFVCSIEEICPDMARTIAKDIIPVLRRSLRRRRAAVLALFLPAFFTPAPSDAAGLHNNFSPIVICIACILRWILKRRIFLTAA